MKESHPLSIEFVLSMRFHACYITCHSAIILLIQQHFGSHDITTISRSISNKPVFEFFVGFRILDYGVQHNSGDSHLVLEMLGCLFFHYRSFQLPRCRTSVAVATNGATVWPKKWAPGQQVGICILTDHNVQWLSELILNRTVTATSFCHKAHVASQPVVSALQQIRDIYIFMTPATMNMFPTWRVVFDTYPIW